MHKYNKLFFSVLIFLIACKGNKAPDGIIQEEQMTNLLTDIHIVDGSMYNMMQTPDTLYKYGTDKYRVLFKKYHTDSTQFKKSFKYYNVHPDRLQLMYEQIVKNIKKKSDSVTLLTKQQMLKDNKRKADSISKLPKKAPIEPASPVAPQNTSPNFKPKKGNALPIK